jgi:hypothetical protein
MKTDLAFHLPGFGDRQMDIAAEPFTDAFEASLLIILFREHLERFGDA